MSKLLQLHMDEHGAIQNPHLTSHPGREARRPWGGYMYRRVNAVRVVRDAFLPRDETGRWVEVARVPHGAYLGFGAEILERDGTWVKSRSLYQVMERTHTQLTLRPIEERDVPALHETAPEDDPRLDWLADELARTLRHVQWLMQTVQLVRSNRAADDASLEINLTVGVQKLSSAEDLIVDSDDAIPLPVSSAHGESKSATDL